VQLRTLTLLTFLCASLAAPGCCKTPPAATPSQAASPAPAPAPDTLPTPTPTPDVSLAPAPSSDVSPATSRSHSSALRGLADAQAAPVGTVRTLKGGIVSRNRGAVRARAEKLENAAQVRGNLPSPAGPVP
jgi:hypothetical protein